MDLALGAMGSLLPKLGELLNEEYRMQTSVKKDVESFSSELASMHAALRRAAEVPRDQLDEEVKLWAGDVRELSYDMEDVVDDLLVRIKNSNTDTDMNVFKELVGKMTSLFKKGKARRQIATAIKDIKEQIQDVAARHERYKADGTFSNLGSATRITTVDPLLVALYEDKQRLVGIDKARDELIEKLRMDDDVSNQPIKILSIVGFGGLGKTTLAKVVYDKLKSKFDCVAFVSVSRFPDLKKVLKDLLFEVDKEKYYKNVSGATLDERQLINELRESLGSKRYFIVIDDIWDLNAWKSIKFSLMAGGKCGSKIITTTRNVSVSKECCYSDDGMVYNMKPLSNVDSQRLFYNRIFPRDNICPPELEQVSKDILKKCGGVPLVIITLASHLASNQQIKEKSQWKVLLNSIGNGLTKGDTNLEEMRRILSLSYYDLPSHLKTCLLYLGIFPEDHRIDRDRLIRRWIAEGFIQGENLFELAESYFNELINRSMIQPINIDVEGRANGCLVHDMMLDLICDLSTDESFVTILDVIKGDKPFKRRVRRLSFQKSMTQFTNTLLTTTSMSQVRSFTIFSPAINQMFPLSRFKFLRVLDLEDCDLSEGRYHNLGCLRYLLHLKYLGLRETTIPSEILIEVGKLQSLEILDLHGVPVGELPETFFYLRNLVCLYFDDSLPAIVPVGIRNLTSLEELTGVVFTKDGVHDNVEALCNLTQLRVLSFFWPSSRCPPEEIVILVKRLGELHKVQRLKIITRIGNMDGDPMRVTWVPPPHLRRLELQLEFQALPTWISSSWLPSLSYLDINVYEVGLDDIQILGTLPALRYVHLRSPASFGIAITEEREVMQRSTTFMLSANAFPCARECRFEGFILVPWMFAPGSMPMVRSLGLCLQVSDILDGTGGHLDLSITNLPPLEKLSVNLGEEELSVDLGDEELFLPQRKREEYRVGVRCHEAHAALKTAMRNHPNRPSIFICSGVDKV